MARLSLETLYENSGCHWTAQRNFGAKYEIITKIKRTVFNFLFLNKKGIKNKEIKKKGKIETK